MPGTLDARSFPHTDTHFVHGIFFDDDMPGSHVDMRSSSYKMETALKMGAFTSPSTLNACVAELTSSR